MDKTLHEIDKNDHAFVIDQGYSRGNQSTIVASSYGDACVSLLQDSDVILVSKDRIPDLIKALNKLK